MTLPRLLAAAGCAVLALAATCAAARPFTAADLVSLDRASDPHVSPDGKTVAFVLRQTDLEKNRGVTALMLVDLVEGDHTTVRIDGPQDDGSSPRWSSDGATLFYLKGGQVWSTRGDGCSGLRFTPNRRPGAPPAICVPSAQPRQVTHLPLDVDTFRVSPDGKRLIVSMAVFPDADDPAATKARLDARKADKSSGQLYDKLFVRHWDTWADGTRNHLFAVNLDADTGFAIPLTPGFDGDVPGRPFGGDDDYALSPDGRTVYFSARVAGRTEPFSTNFDIFRVPADGSAAPVDITAANMAWDAGPVVSPDGTRLAYRAMKRPGFEADRFGVRVMDLTTGATREIDSSWDRSAESLKWSPDGRTLYLAAADTQTERLYAMDAQSGRVAPLTTGGHVTEYDLAGPRSHIPARQHGRPGAALSHLRSRWRAGRAAQPLRRRQARGRGERAVRELHLPRLERRAGARLGGEAGRLPARPQVPHRLPDSRRPAGQLGRQLELPLEPAVLRGAGLRGGDGRFPRLHRLRPSLHRRDLRPLGRPPAGGPAEGLGRRPGQVPVGGRLQRLRPRSQLRRLHDLLDRGRVERAVEVPGGPRRRLRRPHDGLLHRGGCGSRPGSTVGPTATCPGKTPPPTNASTRSPR